MELTSQCLINSYFLYARLLYTENKYVVEGASERIANTFISLLSEKINLSSIGVDFLYQYLNFQFLYWKNLTINSFDGKMKLSFIFGKKALERFLNRNREFDWQLETNEIVSLIPKSHLRNQLSIKNNIEKSNKIESFYRKMNHNTEIGLSKCIIYTSLYQPKDQLCIDCIFKQNCQELLRVNYPKLYEQRGIN